MTSLGHIRSIQDGRNNTDSLCSSLQNVVQILEVNPADGEPWYFYIGGSPADVLQRDGFRIRFGAGGINRTNGNVSCTRRHRPLGLFRRMGTETDWDGARRFSGRQPAFEKILLPQMA